MANERVSMRNTKEVLTQKFDLGRSHREVAVSIGRSAGTVGALVARARAARLVDWVTVNVLDDETLDKKLYGQRKKTEEHEDVRVCHKRRHRGRGTLRSEVERDTRYFVGYNFWRDDKFAVVIACVRKIPRQRGSCQSASRPQATRYSLHQRHLQFVHARSFVPRKYRCIWHDQTKMRLCAEIKSVQPFPTAMSR